MVEFIAIRQRIELLAKQIETTTAQKATAESISRLKEATRLLVTLATMADNDVQRLSWAFTRQLVTLGTKVKALAAKTNHEKTIRCLKDISSSTKVQKIYFIESK